jgi:hypothetical protein
MPGAMAEIILHSRRLDAEERIAIEQYLMQKAS